MGRDATRRDGTDMGNTICPPILWRGHKKHCMNTTYVNVLLLGTWMDFVLNMQWSTCKLCSAEIRTPCNKPGCYLTYQYRLPLKTHSKIYLCHPHFDVVHLSLYYDTTILQHSVPFWYIIVFCQHTFTYGKR